MKEIVYHSKIEADLNTIPSTIGIEYFYLPERGLKFLKYASNDWRVIKLKEEIPTDASLLEIEKSKLDRLMDIYEKLRKAKEAFAGHGIFEIFELQSEFSKVCKETFIV